MSKHTKQVSTKRKQKIKNQLIEKEIKRFIDGEIETNQIYCYWCHEPIDDDKITLDHVKELSNHGSWYDISNIVLSCSTCNNLRSNNPKKFKERLHDLNTR